MNDSSTKLLLTRVFLVAVFGIPLVGSALLAYTLFIIAPVQPSKYADALSTDANTYASLTPIPADLIVQHAYAYESNPFVNALNQTKAPPKIAHPIIANPQGQLPAFRFGEDVFVIIDKGRNYSAGLAISSDPEFSKKIEAVQAHFRVRHISGEVYQWNLELDDSLRAP